MKIGNKYSLSLTFVSHSSELDYRPINSEGYCDESWSRLQPQEIEKNRGEVEYKNEASQLITIGPSLKTHQSHTIEYRIKKIVSRDTERE